MMWSRMQSLGIFSIESYQKYNYYHVGVMVIFLEL